MVINLYELLTGRKESLSFENYIELKKGISKIEKTEDIYIEGTITCTVEGIYLLSMSINGIIYINNKPKTIDLYVNEVLTKYKDKNEKYIILESNHLDLEPIILQHLLLEQI